MAVTETTESTSTAPPTAPFVPITSSAWWHRHLDPEERKRVMDELAITKVEHWAWRFTVMLTLSVVVAVMGLSANSAAVVIGAMLLAPLMQPVLATAACLSMMLLRKSFGALLKVVVATAWCIAIAYFLSLILPDGALSAEVEARTRPDIRDLVVALAAGAAGAYATVRRDASSALPGVAVAVALVPPLGTIGITLEAGERDLAVGAGLLYGTNLAAIIFAGVMVFIATGFVPPRRLANTAVQLLVAAIVALAVVVVVAVPLYNRSVEAVDAAEDELRAEAIVADWLGSVDLRPDVDVDESRIFVQLRGFDFPPDEATLRDELTRAFGEDAAVSVQWIRTERATTTTTTPVVISDTEALRLQVEPVVVAWLADNDQGADYQLADVRVADGGLTIDVSGIGEPPPIADLLDRLAAEVGTELEVRLNWDPLEAITVEEVTPVEATAAEMAPIVEAWADEFGVEITDWNYDGERVRIEAAGATEPRIDRLIDDLSAVADTDGDDVAIEVYFTQQRLVTTTTTMIVVDVFGGGAIPTTTTTTSG